MVTATAFNESVPAGAAAGHAYCLQPRPRDGERRLGEAALCGESGGQADCEDHHDDGRADGAGAQGPQ